MRWSATLFALVQIILTGCEKIFFEEEISNTPRNCFDVFWNDFDKYYAQFEIRNINWDSVYTIYDPLITPATTELELFNYLSEIVGFINDGHVNLFSPHGTSGCDNCSANNTRNRLLNARKYLVSGPPQEYGEVIEYRTVKNHNIGYLLSKSFNSAGGGLDYVDERYTVIDAIINEFKDMDGIIIDVRDNTGGSRISAETIAGRFTREKRLYNRTYQKIGSGADDFSGWNDHFIEPAGSIQFLKPVVVLTSRTTFSAAEIFVLAMEVNPHVALLGDTTRGGIGSPIYRELPNGWTFRLSTLVGATADGYIIEGKGIRPDYPVVNSPTDSINGIDSMLEKAIEIIENHK